MVVVGIVDFMDCVIVGGMELFGGVSIVFDGLEGRCYSYYFRIVFRIVVVLV